MTNLTLKFLEDNINRETGSFITGVVHKKKNPQHVRRGTIIDAKKQKCSSILIKKMLSNVNNRVSIGSVTNHF